MKKSNIINLFNGLNGLGNYTGVKFSYTIAKNLAVLKPEVESLEKAIKASDEFNEFEKARVELAKKFAKKDDKGNPVVNGREYVIEDPKAFDEALEVLKAEPEHKKAIEARENQIEEYKKLVEEESTIELIKIPLDLLPKDIAVNHFYAISDIINEMDEKE